tara:strand:- start:516 stop:1145 length:630 start_codon:yes stop_codon:yes gene_type:complete
MDIKKLLIIAAIAFLAIIGFNYYSSAQSEKARAARAAEVDALKASIPQPSIQPLVATKASEPTKQPETIAQATPVASDDELFGAPKAVIAKVDTAKKDKLIADKAKLDNALLRWNDAMKIALTTPRIHLGDKIENLQAIKLEVLSMSLNPCMNEPRNRLANAMSIFIDGLLEFKSNTSIGVFLFEDYAKKANKDMGLYQVISNQCISLV